MGKRTILQVHRQNTLLFNKYLLRPIFVVGTVLGARDILSKMSKNACFLKKDFIEKQKQTNQTTRTGTES